MSFVKNVERLKDLHSKGVDKFIQGDEKYTLFEYATGVGKSKQAIDCLKAFGTDKLPVILVYWEVAHKQNWLDEFEKWDDSGMIDKITLVTYASLMKHLGNQDAESKYLMIFDEAHHMLMPTIWPDVDKYIHRAVLLTATMPPKRYSKILTRYRPLRIKYDIAKAINDSVLPEPKIWIVNSNLDNYTRSEIIEITKGPKQKLENMETVVCNYGQHFAYLKGVKVIKLAVKATPFEKLTHLQQQVDYNEQIYYAQKQKWALVKWQRAGGARKQFIGDSKDYEIKSLVNKMSGKRGIVFCSSVAQADRIGGKAAVHSKIKTKERNERIEQFQEREIDTLYVNKMLVEGMNLVGIDYVIIAQLDKESLTMIQKMGRGMRSDFPEIFIIVLPNSADAVYLKKNIEALPQGSVDNLMNRNTP